MTYSTKTIHHEFQSYRLKQSFTLAAKRYIPNKSNPHGLTPLFFHCAGSRTCAHSSKIYVSVYIAVLQTRKHGSPRSSVYWLSTPLRQSSAKHRRSTCQTTAKRGS